MLNQILPNLVIEDLGLIEYERAHTTQRERVDRAIQGHGQTILICEHPPVITTGRLADARHMLYSKVQIEESGVKIYPTDRGGDITLHAPGQLVVYPILNLANYGKDLRIYLHRLEQVAIDLLSDFGIVANRFHGQTGVWVRESKIVSIGIGVRKWVSFHGLAINVNTDLSLYRMIKPCGLDITMTSIADIKGERVSMELVKEKVINCFLLHFNNDPARS